MSATTASRARLDRVVADVLGGFGFDADVEVRMPNMEAPVDAIWTEALLVEIVDSRLDSPAESVGLSVRLEAAAIEITVWDDGTPAQFPEIVHLLAAKLRATVSPPRSHSGRTATLVQIPF